MASQDLYGVLGVARGANDLELKRAYRKLAMQWHPDKNREQGPEAEERFKDIAIAYEVLADPQRRATYDQFGEDGLKANGMGATADFSTRSAQDIFAEFFGARSASLGGEADASGYESIFSGMGTYGGGGAGRALKKDPPLTHVLACTLEELYGGVQRRMKVARSTLGAAGQPCKASEVLLIDVKPGWKRGTKVTFPEKGDERPGVIPADVIFVVEEKPHPRFEREGNDLLCTHRLPLVDALCGTAVSVGTLDGRNLRIPLADVVATGSEMKVPGEGMPVAKAGGQQYGDLRIRFEVVFPKALSGLQKQSLRNLLPSGPSGPALRQAGSHEA